MAHNLEYLITRPGILKLVTIVFGIIAHSLGTSSYFESPYTDYYANATADGNPKNLPGTELELFHLMVSGFFLVVSVIYLTLYGFIYELCESTFNRLLDTAIHMVGALLVFAGGCVVMYSAVEVEDYGCSVYSSDSGLKPVPYVTILFQREVECHQFDEKIVGGGFSILNSIIYCVTAVTVFITKDL